MKNVYLFILLIAFAIRVNAQCPPLIGGTITPASSIVCPGNTITLTLNGASSGTHRWEYTINNISWFPVGNNSTTCTSIANSGLATYRCITINGSSKCWDVSSTSATVDVSHPNIAINVTSLTDQSITLNWSPAGSGNYTVSWSGASSGSTTNATPPKTISGLTGGGTYSITVTQTGAGLSGCPASGTLVVTTLCNAPGNVTATAPAMHELDVNWAGPVGNYRLFYRPLFTSTAFNTKDVTGATSATITKLGASPLPASTTYEIYVSRLDCPTIGIQGQPSLKTYATTPPAPACAVPVIDSVKSSCYSQLDIWMHSSNQYKIYLQQITPTIQTVKTYTISGNYYSIKLGTIGATYLVAVETNCRGTYSNIVAWPNTVSPMPLCGFNSTLVLSNACQNGFQASWNSDVCLSNPTIAYRLYYQQSGATNWKSVLVTPPPSPQNPHVTITGLILGQSYIAYVRPAYNCLGSVTVGAASNISSITTLNVPCRLEDESTNDTLTIKNHFSANGKEAISFYPNPNSGQFEMNISGPDNNEEIKLEVINELGETIMTHFTSLNNGLLNEYIRLPENTVNGIYFLRVIAGPNVYTSRINIAR